MIIAVVIRALGTVPKPLERRLEKLEIRGRNKTTQTTAWLKSARIQRSEIPSANVYRKNSQAVIHNKNTRK